MADPVGGLGLPWNVQEEDWIPPPDVVLTPRIRYRESIFRGPGEEGHEVFFEGGKLGLSNQEDSLFSRMLDLGGLVGKELTSEQLATSARLLERGLVALTRLS